MEVGDKMEQPARRRSWLGSKWARVAIVVLGLVLLVSVIVVIAFNNADATKLAASTATSNAALVERLGSPMKTGRLIGGAIEVTPGTGTADLAIPISGPRAKGTLYALAVKEAGVWKLTSLKYGADGESSRLDLLPQ